jgi:hypothetical protein
MNIFVVDSCPITAAQSLCDAHVVKMVLESAQMLSTVQILSGTFDERLYKPTHANHPCTLWARESKANYEWLYLHFVGLADEYNHRYNKIHKSFQKLEGVLSQVPSGLPDSVLSPFAQAMPDEFKRACAVEAYRVYYDLKSRTMHRFTYSYRVKPEWLCPPISLPINDHV